MNLHGGRAVFAKELMDGLRDRRAIFSVVVSAVLGPALVLFMFNRMAVRQRAAQEIKVPVVGAERAQALVDWLRQQPGVEITAGPKDPRAAVQNREEEYVLVIPGDFAEKFSKAMPAPVKIISDSSRQTARPKVQRLRQLLARYSEEIGSLRLISRGLSPLAARTLRIDEVEISSAQQRAATILSFIPMFILMGAFVGGMQVATDSTAGERERGSLEPLLLNPVPRWQIVGGKWLASVMFAGVSASLTLLLCLFGLQYVDFQEFGLRFRMGPEIVGGLLACILPVALLAPAVQVVVATFARSFKEAQSYLTLVVLLPLLPGFAITFYPMTSSVWTSPIPIIGQYLIANDTLGGKPPGLLLHLIAGFSTLALALLLVMVATRLFERERIIFGR
ncbi:MAG: ABC transporter permease [Acidimicrobiia bacterium]|nr:ABC transporter permease [Acidimicrobiia bacterium]